ncbi:S-adenosyl-L-methionine-dependent methyltransferase [Glonium stellatum]|uniref:S-adenosyl-L-methionine-dependent methyltransferase n=1 Tax=Glonium stellatum TaxID=574774 RepID=A0A8E2EX56_9PEZI|nr:S-adenosyl-L-methionine-dependent methyltransferase [Glonium stellatum]
MRYIRFLKPPRVEKNTLKTLITITSDLGETFLPDDVFLAATLHSDDPEGDIYLRKILKWTGGMRSLPIVFDLAFTDLDWPIRVHVGIKGSPNSDHFEKHHNAELPSIISAWSALVDVRKGMNEAEKRVERRFTLLSNRTLSIWEETGESIARHLWDAGMALSAFLDRMVVLQVGGPPLLEEILSSATYKRLKVLELGSGCGIVGIGLAQTIPDCEVVLTDLPEAEEIAMKNINGMNAAMSSDISFHTLDWDDPLPRLIKDRLFDIILVADCTYNPDSSPALVRTLAALVKWSSKAIVVVAMKVRHSSEAVFFDLMSESGFIIRSRTILPIPGDEKTAHEKIDVYVFCDKNRSQIINMSLDAHGPPAIPFWQS